MSRNIADAYLKGEAGAFFPAHPSDIAHRLRLVAEVSRPLAPGVAADLRVQNGAYVVSPARDENLARLAAGAAAVVTGQQAGLFLGPLYTIYKAAAAIKNARELARESGRPVVPVFWLQTEDHDLPEIASCDFSLRLPCAEHERISVEHRVLPAAVSELLAKLSERIGSGAHAAAHVAMLARHYRPGAGWGTAFAGAIAELFAPEGLVLVNPRTPALAAAAAPVHRRALEDASRLSQLLAARTAELRAAGFSASVHIRADSPLSFFHPSGPASSRHRLAPLSRGVFREVGGGGTHTLDALLAALADDPLSFSTSALLRPLVQDAVLPTVAYVGGPGEIAYFAQLSPLYDVFARRMPVVVPRARFRVVEPRIARLLATRALSPAPPAAAVPDPELDGLTAAFDAALESLVSKIESAHADLATPARKTRSTVRRAVGKLRGKHAAATRSRDPAEADLREIDAAFTPDGEPQERVFGLPRYAALVGDRRFVEQVLEAVVPFDGSLKDLPL